MKILHIVHQFPPETHGGLETYVRDLAHAQLNQEHEVVILAGNMEPRERVCLEDAPFDGLSIKRLYRNDLFFDDWDKGYCPEVLPLVLKEVKQGGYDLVHLHHWIRLTHDMVQQLTAQGTPCVVTLHDYGTSCPRCFRTPPGAASCDEPLSVGSCLSCVPRRLWQSDEEISLGIELFRENYSAELLRADRVLCASSSLASSVSDYIGLGDKVRFEVLPLGYEPRFSSPSPPPEDGLTIGYWGAVTRRKGVDLLIEAFGQVVDRQPKRQDLSLHIFGTVDRAELAQDLEARSEGLDVTFHGRFEYEDLIAAKLNLAVFPSRCMETYGLVLDEAFELGLGVVVPDIGALPERAGEAGLVFKAEDSASLAGCLEKALDTDCRTRLQSNIPSPGLDSAAHAEEILAIYQDVLDHPRSPSDLPPAVSVQRRLEWLTLKSENQFRRLIQ